MTVTEPFGQRGVKAVPKADPAPAVAYDLDAVIAEREPIAPFTFRFGGQVYELPAHADMIAAAALDAGRLEEGLARMLGAEQYARLVESEAVFDDVALINLFKAYSEYTGEDLGESAASPTSSRNTAKR